MGGNLLSQIWSLPPKRIPRVEFDRITLEIVAALKQALPNHKIEPLGFFAEKVDFGDLDIAVESKSGSDINWIEKLKEIFNIEYRPHKNGNCVSFPYDGFQVDILLFSSECWECALTYYKFEAGNFQGRIADALGLSYGHRGLYLQVPLSYFKEGYPEHQYRDILISRNPNDIFQILGFSLRRFDEGFDNFEAMSYWVADSDYFSPEVFAFDALNSINRTRNRKRPVYAAFVEWCKTQRPRLAMPSKEEMRAHLIQNYRLENVILNIKNELLKNEGRREKFNGNLINDLFELEGQDLGKFIVAFKGNYDNFDEWLDANSPEQVQAALVEYRSTHL